MTRQKTCRPSTGSYVSMMVRRRSCSSEPVFITKVSVITMTGDERRRLVAGFSVMCNEALVSVA